MGFLSKKSVIIIVAILAVFGLFIFLGARNSSQEVVPLKPVVYSGLTSQKVIGTSVEGRSIASYTYGSGDKHLLFVGGMHGGYEWNSVYLAYKFMDYLNNTRDAIPAGLTVTVIPSINPDGVFAVTGKNGRFTVADVSTSSKTLAAGRFNANTVDLNRNFDCKWQPKATWQSKTTSAGTAAFSEPETTALKNFVAQYNPVSVVFWHSQSNAVYASECKNGILPVTLDIMNAYGKASGYSVVKTFDAYAVTGDAEGWLASINIPAITVELKTHDTIEWDKNLSGVKALFNYFSNDKIIK